LRRLLRLCLQSNGLNPDAFTQKEMDLLYKSGKVIMPSGIPIRTVRVVVSIKDPVVISKRGAAPRVYESRNNHHTEILEDRETGQWTGRCWSMMDVVQRVRPNKKRHQSALPMVIGRKLDSLLADKSIPDELLSFYRGKKFVMSLSQGEVISARRPDRDHDDPTAVGYFVVVKMRKGQVTFAPHWDSRPASEQDRWVTSPGKLKALGPSTGSPPCKVTVSPLGNIRILKD